MTHKKTTKWLSVLLAVCMLAVMLPAVLSFAADNPDAAFDEKLSGEDNLAINAVVNSQYGAHSDAQWGWDINKVTDGSTNYLMNGTQVGNGSYHSNPHVAYGQNGLSAINHEEWVSIDMGESKTFTTVEIYPCRDSDSICHAFPNTFDVEVSVDGTNWLTVSHVGNVKYGEGEYAPTIVQFDEVTARFVRVNAFSLNKDVNGK